MSSIRRKSFAVVAASLTMAAMLGGSLGFVAAGARDPLGSGFNVVGGPLSGDVGPAAFVQCLPASSWKAIYIWNSANQQWQHFFNTTKGFPAYINLGQAGGISTIPKLSGVVLLMDSAVSNPFLKDTSAQACP
jgi:hypothetical protein